MLRLSKGLLSVVYFQSYKLLQNKKASQSSGKKKGKLSIGLTT